MLKRHILLLCIFSFFCGSLLFLQAEETGIVPNVANWEELKWEEMEGDELTFFVDSGISSKQKSLGTEKLPFKTIDEALSHITTFKKKGKKIKVVLNIKGNFISSYSYVINSPIKIVSLSKNKKTKSSIEFRKNAGFMLSSSFLMLENFSLIRKETVGEPRTVPLFYVSSSKMKLKDVNIDVKEGGGVFYLLSSKFELDNVFINSRQSDYCNIAELISSKAKISSSKFISVSKGAIALDASESEVMVEGLSYEASSSYFSFVVRAFSSKMSIANTTLIEKGSSKDRRVAIIHDKNSQLQESKVTLSGFSKIAEVRNGRLDYLK